jgi:hypothetical protein
MAVADPPFTFTVEPGLWTLFVAAPIALAGGLLVQDWSPRPPEHEHEPDAVVIYQLPDDAQTPPLGFPQPADLTVEPRDRDGAT